MRIVLCSLVVGAWLTGISVAQTPAQPQAPAQPQTPATGPTSAATPPMTMNFTPGTLIRVALEKPIDAKKAQVGDQVLAKTTDDLNSVPPGLATKGCKIVGHIVEVTPHQGDTASTIRIVFDKMILKNNSDMALPATIKAVGYADQFDPATNSETITAMGGGPAGSQPIVKIGSGGGDPGLYQGDRMPAGTPNGRPGSTSATLPFNAQGTVGMPGVTLSAGSAQDSILTSKKHNVKLDSGMQMILKTH
ncbi:MAG TPA: hypothetical protein VJX30_02960 [Terriglobales bacterium]|jgi:hypothetical protein|nr:hypothetical protein [Terriglobales bacterium]